MEFTWKKIAAICLVFILIIGGPLILFSNPMMDYFQEKCDKDPKNNKWLQMKVAEACYKTTRYDRALNAYYKYWERYPDDPEREYALYRWCLCVEETSSTRDGLKGWEHFLSLYPEGQYAKDANDGMIRIKYHKPNK